MSTIRGHYVPVAARRDVLKIYRSRRTRGPLGMGRPMTPIAAMRATVEFYSGWLAEAVAFEPIGRHTVQELTDQFRAAEFYMSRMYDKPEQFQRAGRHDLPEARR